MRVTVVTGGGGGIGRAVARALAGPDTAVVVVDRDAGAAAQTLAEVEAAGGTGTVVEADVTRSADVARYVEAARSFTGRIDALANNAGIEGVVAPLAEYPEDVFDAVLGVNVKGIFLGLRHVLPVMLEAGSGAIVNTGSTSSIRGRANLGYLHALDTPTEGTRRYLPLFGAMARTGCRVTHSAGTGEGGDVAFVEFGPGADPDGLRRWVVDELAPALLARSGVLAVHLAEADADATAVRDRTESYKDVPTWSGRWLLLVEGATVDHAAARERLSADVAELSAHGADVGGSELFRLLARLE